MRMGVAAAAVLMLAACAPAGDLAVGRPLVREPSGTAMGAEQRPGGLNQARRSYLEIAQGLGLATPSDAELARRRARAMRQPLGSRANPVLADMPAGQAAYLARLRCPGGAAPAATRAGNLGPGPYGTIVDEYRVTCPDGTSAAVVMDMYHGGYVEAGAVPGFTIVPAG